LVVYSIFGASLGILNPVHFYALKTQRQTHTLGADIFNTVQVYGREQILYWLTSRITIFTLN